MSTLSLNWTSEALKKKNFVLLCNWTKIFFFLLETQKKQQSLIFGCRSNWLALIICRYAAKENPLMKNFNTEGQGWMQILIDLIYCSFLPRFAPAIFSSLVIQIFFFRLFRTKVRIKLHKPYPDGMNTWKHQMSHACLLHFRCRIVCFNILELFMNLVLICYIKQQHRSDIACR